MRFFVSYSRSIQADVEAIVKLLRAAEHEVWWDGDIPVIADWWATILDKIEWCQVFVFMVSEKAVKSPYCLTELEYAKALNIPVLPFLMDDEARYTILPEVIPMRNQWFKYTGDSAHVLGSIRESCKRINWRQFPRMPAQRPIEPNSGSGSLIEQFQQAVDLAGDGHFTEAIQRLRNVASLDDLEWGDECREWIARLQEYEPIAKLARHPATQKRARQKWSNYLEKYSNRFDPFDIAEQLQSKPREQPKSAEQETTLPPGAVDFSPLAADTSEFAADTKSLGGLSEQSIPEVPPVISPEVIQRRWLDMLKAVNKYSSTGTSVLEHYQVHHVDGNTVYICTDHVMFFDRLNGEKQKLGVVERALYDVHKVGLRVQVLLVDDISPIADLDISSNTNTDDPIIRHALELGAQMWDGIPGLQEPYAVGLSSEDQSSSEPAESYNIYEPPDFLSESYAFDQRRWIKIYFPRSEDSSIDRRRLRRLHGILISYPGTDRFTIVLDVSGKSIALEFPNYTTGYCDDLTRDLLDIVENENNIEVIVH